MSCKIVINFLLPQYTVHTVTIVNMGKTLVGDVQLKLTICMHLEWTGMGGGSIPWVFKKQYNQGLY